MNLFCRLTKIKVTLLKGSVLTNIIYSEAFKSNNHYYTRCILCNINFSNQDEGNMGKTNWDRFFCMIIILEHNCTMLV